MIVSALLPKLPQGNESYLYISALMHPWMCRPPLGAVLLRAAAVNSQKQLLLTIGWHCLVIEDVTVRYHHLPYD